MSSVQPGYEDFLRTFREEIDEHLHWQEAQQYYGIVTIEAGWRRAARAVFEEMEQLRTAGKIPSPRFRRALDDFYALYAS